ncbi:MAG: thermonuclease family protein [Candidatus Hydrogenedentes bacterium]|nr:thermonuclease family protein [Candidatus Hydrogenedentota bacterium]
MWNQRLIKLLVTITLCVMLSTPSWGAESWVGVVVRVVDGDTIEVAQNGKNVTVRLFGIDAPENDQPYSGVVTTAMSELCLDKKVQVLPVDIDKYGRTVANVVLLSDRINLSQEAVKNGYAWWYREFAPKDMKLQSLQLDALTSNKGLWADASAIPPWDWRAGKRGAASVQSEDTGSEKKPTNSKKQSQLSEASRRAVFHAIVAAEDRAMKEAMASVPNSEIMKQIELERALQTKYKQAVAREYGVTDEQMREIAVEGVKNGWLR